MFDAVSDDLDPAAVDRNNGAELEEKGGGGDDNEDKTAASAADEDDIDDKGKRSSEESLKSRTLKSQKLSNKLMDSEKHQMRKAHKRWLTLLPNRTLGVSRARIRKPLCACEKKSSYRHKATLQKKTCATVSTQKLHHASIVR